MLFPLFTRLDTDMKILPKAALTEHFVDGVARISCRLETSLLFDRLACGPGTPCELGATLILFKTMLT